MLAIPSSESGMCRKGLALGIQCGPPNQSVNLGNQSVARFKSEQ